MRIATEGLQPRPLPPDFVPAPVTTNLSVPEPQVARSLEDKTNDGVGQDDKLYGHNVMARPEPITVGKTEVKTVTNKHFFELPGTIVFGIYLSLIVSCFMTGTAPSMLYQLLSTALCGELALFVCRKLKRATSALLQTPLLITLSNLWKTSLTMAKCSLSRSGSTRDLTGASVDAP